MKQLLIYLLVLSIGLNIYFLIRKFKRIERADELLKLYAHKSISHKEGYDFFLNQIQRKYPQTKIDHKYFIVYRWDSTMYDFIYRDQMKVMDSMAASYGKYTFEYVFVTEMEKFAAENFLVRNHDEYKNVKKLYGMDDFVSGLYGLKSIKLNEPRRFNGLSKKTNETDVGDIHKFKQRSLYLIMDSKGSILHTNGNKSMILKDSAFFNKLNSLMPDENPKIIN